MTINNVQVYGLLESIIASGYPMMTKVGNWMDDCRGQPDEIVGEKDLKRATNLANTPIGSGHSTFLQGALIQFDVTFTVKAWTEAERYHFLDFVSSQSTMHRITKFDLDSAYIEYVDPRIIAIMKEKVEEYKQLSGDEATQKYLEILYSNPCGFKLTARMTTNYQQLRTIYRQRKNHRLPEWREFCAWIETLPYAKELIIGECNGQN